MVKMNQKSSFIQTLNSVPQALTLDSGDAFSMADIPLGAVLYRYFNIDIERPVFPHIEAWYARLCERPAYKKHVMRFFGTNPDEWQALERESAGDGKA